MRVSQRRSTLPLPLWWCGAALFVALLLAPAPADAAPVAWLRRARRAAPAPTPAQTPDAQGEVEGDEEDEGAPFAGAQRAQKQLQLPYYAYLPPQFAPGAAPGVLPPQYYDYTAAYQEADDNEVLSRAEPTSASGGRKPAAYPDSPVYYIRMPPTPYVFVPGLGYVSQPPPPPPAFSPFINLPVDFVANGKPTSVYWRPAARPPPPPPPPQRPPAPTQTPQGQGQGQDGEGESSVTQLDQGPYVFNGRPTDLFVLRNTYNSLYNDALQNIYP